MMRFFHFANPRQRVTVRLRTMTARKVFLMYSFALSLIRVRS